MAKLDAYEACTMARVLAQDAGLSGVVFHKGPEAYITPKGQIHVQEPSGSWDSDGPEAMAWRNSIRHEVGHWTPETRGCFDVARKYGVDMTTLRGVVLNFVADMRNDRLRCLKYPGHRADHLGHTEQLIRSGLIPKLNKGLGGPECVVATVAAFSVLVSAVQEDDPGARTAELVRDILDSVPEQVEEKLNRLLSEGWVEYLEALTDSEDEYQYALDLLALWDLPEEEDQDDSGDDSEQSERDEADPDVSEDSEEDSGPGEEDDSESEGGSSEPGDEPSEPQKESSMADSKPSNAPDWMNHDNPERLEDTARDRYDRPYDVSDYQPHDATTTYAGSADTLSVVWRVHKLWDPAQRDFEQPIRKACRSLSMGHTVRKAKQYLLTATRARVSRDLDYGILDTTRLTKVATARTGEAVRIFKRRTVTQALDTSVMVLVDCSGSMRHSEKFLNAFAAAYGLHDVCSSLGVAHSIVGFTERTKDHHILPIFKGFSEGRVNDALLCRRFSVAASHMDQNADGDSIRWAASQLRKRKEPRKLLMVLSDGSPAGCRNGDLYGFTQKVIEEIENDNAIEIMGIGLNDTNVRALYRQSVVIESIPQIPERILEILRDNVLVQR